MNDEKLLNLAGGKILYKDLRDRIKETAEEIPKATADVLRYTSQDLTEAQKDQACTNIDAVSIDQMDTELNDLWDETDTINDTLVKYNCVELLKYKNYTSGTVDGVSFQWADSNRCAVSGTSTAAYARWTMHHISHAVTDEQWGRVKLVPGGTYFLHFSSPSKKVKIEIEYEITQSGGSYDQFVYNAGDALFTIPMSCDAVSISLAVPLDSGEVNETVEYGVYNAPSNMELWNAAVKDVQINGTSVVAGGIAAIPETGVNTFGVCKVHPDYGITILSHTLYINAASEALMKAGNDNNRPITSNKQHISAFYGLAKAAGDTTQSQSSNAVGTYTDEAKSAIKNMLGITQTLTVTVLTQDSVTVTGQTVTVRADDAAGEIYATATYEGQPVSFSLPNGFQYYVSVSDMLDHHFNPTTARGVVTNTDIAVTLTYSDFSTIRTAPDIKAALNAGLDLTDLVGEQITCTKNDETLTWDVVDYDTTNKCVTLLLHDCFGTANMIFEPAQALMWCENGLAAGSYTFTWNTTQCYFTLTTAIPAGGQLRANNTGFWTYESQDATATLETGTVGTEAITGATDLGHEGQGLLNHRDRVSYGSNNYAESALYWWLNSDTPANTKRVPVTKFSRAYSYAQPGFLNGLDSNFIAALDNKVWRCACNNVYECPQELGGYTKGKGQTYTVTAKVGLASEMEIFGSYGGNQDGSTIFDLYDGATADDRKKYRGTAAQIWWLRSPLWYNANSERHVYSSGTALNYHAYSSYGCVPAVSISADA